MNGVDAVIDYYNEDRTVTNTTHEVTREVRDGDTWVCEETVTGEYLDGEPLDGGYVGVFEFAPGSATIRRLSVYTRSVF